MLGGGHHGGRGTMTAATMVEVCVVNVTLPRHIMKPAYCSILLCIFRCLMSGSHESDGCLATPALPVVTAFAGLGLRFECVRHLFCISLMRGAMPLDWMGQSTMVQISNPPRSVDQGNLTRQATHKNPGSSYLLLWQSVRGTKV